MPTWATRSEIGSAIRLAEFAEPGNRVRGVEVASFEWGWDAFVAIGTIALALGTFLLALSTRKAAKASSEDVRAQWRPVIVPGSKVDVDFEEDSEAMSITVRNVGRGAAYYIDAALGVDGIYWPAHDSVAGHRGVENLAVVPTSTDLRLAFDCHDGRPSEAEVLIDYTDLNGRPYSTRIGLDESHLESVLRMSRVELSDNRERIPWKPWTWEPATRREWLKAKIQKQTKEEG